jgi:hypothetical protein
MSANIDFTKTRFYTGVQPPVSASTSYQLTAEWGSRMAIMSARSHGIGAMGTVSAAGTRINFPVGYFTDTPIFEVTQFMEEGVARLYFSAFDTELPFKGGAFVQRIYNLDQCYVEKDGVDIALANVVIAWHAHGI